MFLVVFLFLLVTELMYQVEMGSTAFPFFAFLVFIPCHPLHDAHPKPYHITLYSRPGIQETIGPFFLILLRWEF